MTVTLTWSKNNIPAFKPDPMMPPYLNYMEYVKFSPSQWKTWDDISEWYYGFLFKPQLDITPAITRKARELIRGCSTDKQKIGKILNFVQTLRYVAVELGQGGYVPSKPGAVLERMYGDCKDESILLISLLRSVGITAKPVLVLTADEGVLDPAFPTWMFNHMIVKAIKANGSSFWLDPTAGHCGLGEIPYDDRGTNVLVLNDNNTSQVERIPSSSFAQNAANISADVTVGDSGEANFAVGMRFKGQENLATRDNLAGKTSHELAKFCKSLVADNYLNAEVTSCSLDNVDNPDTALTLHLNLKVPSALQTQGHMILLDIDPFRISGDWSWLAHNNRTYDIRFDYPHIITKTIDVRLPRQYSVRQLPPMIIDSTAGLYFSKSYMRTDSTRFEVTETLAVTSQTIDHRKFESVKRFAEKMREASKEMILLSRKQDAGFSQAK